MVGNQVQSAAAAAAGACPNPSVRSSKKGAALGPTFSARDRTSGPFPTDASLKALNVSWHYNWSLEPRFSTDVPFVPMVWGRRGASVPLSADIVLGFNEPDHAKQGNLSPEEALALWPQVAEKGRRVGSPAMAGNLLRSGCWLDLFTDAGGHYDFVTLHWYSGCKADKFMQYIHDVYQKFQKPIWVTEFAPQTTSQCEAKPGAFNQSQVIQFMQEVVPWLESTPYVERYVWYNSYVGPCALFDTAGNLTETGRMYAAVA